MTLTRRAVDNLLPLADTRPAFRDDALRMIGGLPGHPVTRAIRNGALRFDPPDWKDGHAALRYLASLLSDALTRVIADRKLPFKHLPNWDRVLPALNHVFGIDLRHHFLHAAPLEWLQKARLTEPRSPGASPTVSTPAAARPGPDGSGHCCGRWVPTPAAPTAVSARRG